MSAIKAVIFDLGGVLYPFRNYPKFKAMCQRAAVDPEVKRKLVGWQEGTLATTEIKDFFEQTFGELPKDYKDIENVKLDDFMGPKHEKIWKFIVKLRENKVKVGLLTNNGFWTSERKKSVIFEDLSLFDVVVESCREGICKPDPKIFELGLPAKQCAFVDDLEKNVESAIKLGINGIQMVDQNQDLALQRLEKLTGISLQ